MTIWIVSTGATSGQTLTAPSNDFLFVQASSSLYPNSVQQNTSFDIVSNTYIQSLNNPQITPVVDVDRLLRVTAKEIGSGQCVAFVRYALGDKGLNYSGNAIEWAKFVNENHPQIGDIVVFNYGRIGHVAIVYSISQNNFQVIEMNYKGPGVVSTREVSLNDPEVIGYINPNLH